jgi:hypothetical protein
MAHILFHPVAQHDLLAFLGYSLVNFFQEFTKRHPKPLGHGHQSADGSNALTPHYKAHRRTMQTAMVCEGFLREALLGAQLTQPLSKCQKNLLHLFAYLRVNPNHP